MLTFGLLSGRSTASVLASLSRSLALIEFDPTGIILWANENFCTTMGYRLDEIKGRHHRMFVEAKEAGGASYAAFWSKLGRGELDVGEYKRIGQGGREIWIQASYNPVRNARGRVVKIVKQATDISSEKLRTVELQAKLNALSRAQAIIEFTPEGEIITANDNFLSVVGYSLEEIRGKSHRIFVEPAYAQSEDYAAFWRTLKQGEYVAAEFKRIRRNGEAFWIQASYNPIFDLDGRVMKVVKFAIDITERINAVTQLGDGLSRMAHNDFETPIADLFAPTFEPLRSDFNLALGKLKSTLCLIADGTDTIGSGTQEISGAADDLSRRTERQAASLAQTAATLNEITATVKQSAEGADHARRLVAAADDDAKRSAVVVRQAVDGMDGILKSAQQISRIIGVIDEIAFQTNLLALNAGVEAARAGEAGRGFAVVASEVRALAQRSAEAAQEIKGLISTSSMQVDNGVKLVGATGQSLDRILSQVGEINEIVGQFAAGAREQSTGLEEVNVALAQIDQVTQQNAAMVEQTTAASRSLMEETSALSALVAQFQIGRAEAGSRGVRQEKASLAGRSLTVVTDGAARWGARAPKTSGIR